MAKKRHLRLVREGERPRKPKTLKSAVANSDDAVKKNVWDLSDDEFLKSLGLKP